MKSIIRAIRERYHPLFHMRRSAIGRFFIRLLDRPVWLSFGGVPFPVRGQRLTHGWAFAIIGHQEIRPEALTRACLRRFEIQSFWDLGSNVGYYSWLAKSENPAIESVIVEPLPANAALVRATLDRSGLKATLLVAGASDRPGKGILRADHLGGSTSTLETTGETFEERYEGVPAEPLEISLVTVDQIRETHGPVGFMKVDVEGHEAAALQGAVQTIARDQPIIFVECSHPAHKCLDILVSHGYRIVDADHLTLELKEGTQNYFCFPRHQSDSVQELLQSARTIATQAG